MFECITNWPAQIGAPDGGISAALGLYVHLAKIGKLVRGSGRPALV